MRYSKYFELRASFKTTLDSYRCVLGMRVLGRSLLQLLRVQGMTRILRELVDSGEIIYRIYEEDGEVPSSHPNHSS